MAMVLIILLLVLSGSNVIRGSRQLVVATEEKTASLYVFNNANHHQSNQLQHQNHHGNHTHHSNLINPSHHKWDCNRSWPSLELFMPMQSFPSPKHPRYYEAEVNFLRSFLHFWPLSISNTSLVLTYDKETSNSQFVKDMTLTMQALSKRLYGRWNMIGIPTFPYYREGYDRQQYNMFWADNYTTSDYIGFVDTDTIFTTYIDREDLFEDGKPVINAKGAITREAIPTRWFQSTNRTMHMLESLTCMAYFPVIIKRTHLRDIRDYIAKLHGMSFDEAFYRIITLDKNYSQFNIMCAYLWKFKREEYKWYVRMMQLLDGDTIPNPLPGQDPDLTQFSPEMRFPKPFIATHSRYRRTKTNGLVSEIPLIVSPTMFQCLLF